MHEPESDPAPATRPAPTNDPASHSAPTSHPAPVGRPALPLAGQPPAERADAARNRRRILDAAARIVADKGPDSLTMNAVAHASGIGVGTVYRRFGDVQKLLYALLDDREQQFQEAFMSGPPPLGPDALPAPPTPPAVRLRAFLYALADRVAEQQELLLAAESASPRGRYNGAPYLTLHTHAAMLVGQIDPRANAALVAHLLLATLSPSLIQHLHESRGVTAEQIKDGLDQLLSLQLGLPLDLQLGL
ncbi:TetR/AcrR family transcriptional regulator [Streptomyces sp. NPDC048442]|uniref:TetR/AcrR family transcriptional regulator n=1 Tax=Streptomyces sp. NPDC048442 TaxID=3154823 RepID=UPI0034241769